MSAAALLANNPAPSAEDVETAMSGNICRCGCYPRIKEAILSVAGTERPAEQDNSLAYEVSTEVKA